MNTPVENIDNIQIDLNGFCNPNPGKGGFAAIILRSGKEMTISGGLPKTNNMAILVEALLKVLSELRSSLRKPTVITVNTGAEYIADALSHDLEKWECNDWRKNDGERIKNWTLWEKIAAIKSSCEIRGVFKKAYKKSPMGKLTKKLAGEGLERQTTIVTPALS